MSTHDTAAIVLRTVEFSETSLVVTLLTSDLGRVSALAKGARRIKGPFEGSLDLLSVCRVVLISKPGDTLDLLIESKLRKRFRAGEHSLERLYAGYYVAEMLRHLIDDDDPHEELYRLTVATLGMIDGNGPIAESLLAFDCQSLRLLGHAPATKLCTVCGSTVQRVGQRTVFSLIGGGIVCETCRPRQVSLMTVSWRALDCIEQFLRVPIMEPSRVADRESKTTGRETDPSNSDAAASASSLALEPAVRPELKGFPLSSLLQEIPPRTYSEVRHLLNRYLQELLGRAARMQPYLPTKPTSH